MPGPADADFVIVGGGTAGCVLANRLSADPANRVVVLEAGPADTSPWIRMPAGVARLFEHRVLNWRYRTEPEPALGGRSLYWPRGRVLGGTSSINGMTFTRGQRADFDAWADLTAGRWSWTSVAPYFQRFEDSPIAGDTRGQGGPMKLGTIAAPHPLSVAFLRSAVGAGIAENPDYNGAQQEGIAYNQLMMRDGVRVSAASAYLAPVRKRRNLEVLTGAAASRVRVEGGRAVAVEFEREGRVQAVRARREVLLCGGTVASPQLLQLSGIGAADELRALGIEVVVDRPSVGRNLQEHVRGQVVQKTRVPSLNREAVGVRLVGHVARYALRKEGLLAVTASQVNGFARSSPGVARPDLQLVFRPSSGDYRDGRFVIHGHQGLMAMAGLLRPRSRGSILLRSAEPREPPAIRAGHFSDPADIPPLIAGLRLLRRILATPPMRELVGEEVRPGSGLQSDAGLEDYLRRTADSLYHAVGTCAMGSDDASAVTPDLRVRGVEGLRVVDASVMPLVPSGNTTAAVLMIAERAADLILRGRAAASHEVAA